MKRSTLEKLLELQRNALLIGVAFAAAGIRFLLGKMVENKMF
jgi:hypothetical protein